MRSEVNEEKWNNTKWMDLISVCFSFIFSFFASIWLHLSLWAFFFPLNPMQYFIPFSDNSSTVCGLLLGHNSRKKRKTKLLKHSSGWRKHFKQIDNNYTNTQTLYLCPVLILCIWISFHRSHNTHWIGGLSVSGWIVSSSVINIDM